MAKVLKVGIAGFGIVGKRRNDFIEKHENLNTVAVCDRYYKGKEGVQDGVYCYSDYNKLLEHEGLDVLFVCLPNEIAPEITIKGLTKGLHVFCEKPPGRDVSDIKNVIEAEKANPSLKLKYGFNHRYHDSIEQALHLIQDGSLGKIINMRGVYGKAFISPWNEPVSSHWRTCRETAGGGILLDQGIHMVDLMRLFAGEFSDIKSFVTADFWNLDIEDNAYALMKSEKGAVAMLHSTATQWRHKFSLEINLEQGSLILAGILSGSKSYGQETLKVVYRNPKDGGNTKEQLTSYIEDNSWWKEICEFAECIIENKSIKVGTSLDALRTMELVYKIYCADENWKEKYQLTAE